MSPALSLFPGYLINEKHGKRRLRAFLNLGGLLESFYMKDLLQILNAPSTSVCLSLLNNKLSSKDLNCNFLSCYFSILTNVSDFVISCYVNSMKPWAYSIKSYDTGCSDKGYVNLDELIYNFSCQYIILFRLICLLNN